MKPKTNKFVCIHGHFYQPPRENPWLEQIEMQDSAHPFHDWNERITAECYMTNSCSRILDNDGVIKNIVNNYSKISFNFGPTLLSWMEHADPEVYMSILEADDESMKLFGGHGAAIAQVYNHIIMPLANKRDKETQIIWGIRDFQHRFQRYPEGIWLAETAVDYETLELLAEHQIKYTILAPRQAKAMRLISPEGGEWKSVNDSSINIKRPYKCVLPSGSSIALFFYDGKVSQGVAFSGLLNDGARFANEVMNMLDKNSAEPELAHIATDGETYGHHHKKGEMALSFCLDYIEKGKTARLTNYGHYLSMFPPQWEVQIHENSSWSCVHGVERWRENCGCNSGMHGGWHQLWRKPLRDSLNWLRDAVSEVFEREGGMVLRDPWAARNDYISVVLNRNDNTVNEFITKHSFPAASPNQVLRLMEMQRHANLMFTSCGWFFDEISGIETTQIMQYACRVIQIAFQLGERDLEEEFLRLLEVAPSNVPDFRDGATIYRKYAVPSRTNLQRVGMHFAVSSIFEDEPETLTIFNYTTTSESFMRKELGEQCLALGITKVKSIVTQSEKKFAFAVLYLGKHNIIGNISLNMESEMFSNMQFRMLKAFEEGRIGDVIGVMQTYFGPEKYTLWQLFHDEKRKILNQIAQQSMAELEQSLRRTYNRDYPLVTALSNEEIPIPNAYRTSFEYVLNIDLQKAFLGERLNIKMMERVASEMNHWKLKIEDPPKIQHLAGESIYRELERVSDERANINRITRLNRVFPILQQLNLKPELHQTQNLYFEISVDLNKRGRDGIDPEWIEQFNILGDNLGIKVELELS